MRFGIHYESQAPPDQSPKSFVDELCTTTRTACNAGIDMVSMGQHYLMAEKQIQMIPALARLVAECDSMTPITGVLLLPLHHPVAAAEQITTLGVIGEDVVAGVGIGYRDTEFANFEVPKEERVGRTIEGVEIMNQLWTSTDVNYSGKYYTLSDATANPRPSSKPPVWVGGTSIPAIKRAARIGDAWYVHPYTSYQEIEEYKEIYDEIAIERGKSTELPIMRECFVAETTDAAYETARPHLQRKYERYTNWGQDETMEDSSGFEQSFEDIASDRFLIGTPEEVAAEIERYQEAFEMSHLIFRTHWSGMSQETARRSIRLLGDGVIPQF